MKRTPVINSQIAKAIAELGYTDWLVVGDAGLSIPKQVTKIDVAIARQVPTFSEVLQNVLTELSVDRVYVAEEIKTANPDQLDTIKHLLPTIPIVFIPHDVLKQRLGQVSAVIRTGEMTPFSNIILESGPFN
ncbi:D-ribose pyranase [Furfurilactobacillus curtus]|uniref:D-ribose pyranase n=1 Tax=Furfurilactobacillus curtus TaxID=1746200 RepID=A0ABQ5JKU5_9LACO